MRENLSPFGKLVDRALRETLPGIRLSVELTRMITLHLRFALISYLKSHNELSIKGFGTFRRVRRKSEGLNQNKRVEKLRITFIPRSAMEEGEDD